MHGQNEQAAQSTDNPNKLIEAVLIIIRQLLAPRSSWQSMVCLCIPDLGQATHDGLVVRGVLVGDLPCGSIHLRLAQEVHKLQGCLQLAQQILPEVLPAAQ